MFHTPALAGFSQVFRAGVHERDMFGSVADSALLALAAVLRSTRDDYLLLKATMGLYQFATVTAGEGGCVP